MKLRDYVFLLLLLDLPFSSTEHYKDCNYWNESTDKSKIVSTIFLRLTDIMLGFIPGGSNVSPVLWGLLELSSKEASVDYKMIVECHVNQYIRGGLLGNIILHDKRRSEFVQSSNITELEQLKNQLEEPNNMDKIFNPDSSSQAAIFPLLSYWASNHLMIYKDLIKLNRSFKYQLKHDEWAVFYVKLILRYWRSYRNTLQRENPSNTEVFENPAERLLTNWILIPYTSEYRNKISRLLESCKVKKGNRVMFNYYTRTIYHPHTPTHFIRRKNWFSCIGSGSWCRYDSCPSKYENSSPFNYDEKFDYGIDCRGEVFWIYSDNNQIMDEGIVNIQYSCCKDNQGYWVSSSEFGGTNTRGCPGKTFTGIKSHCENENIRITKWRKISKSHKVLYDGNLISWCSLKQLTLKRTKDECQGRIFEIYNDGSETLKDLKSNLVYPPTKDIYKPYLEEIVSHIDGVKDQIDSCTRRYNGECKIDLNTTNGTSISLQYHGGTLWYFHDTMEDISWVEADFYCRNWFGYGVGELASINNQDDYDFLVGVMKSKNWKSLQIGGKFSDTCNYCNKKNWDWTDGTPMNSNLINKLWLPDNPSGYFGEDLEDKMQIHHGYHNVYGLNDVTETYKQGTFVCKIMPCIDRFKDQIEKLDLNDANGHPIRFDCYNGSLYYFNKSKARISWNQAENKCKEMFPGKSELASIDSANVFNYFKSKIQEYQLGYLFVGGKRKTATSSEWIWRDGTSMDEELYNKKYWSKSSHTQQPDNYGGKENSLMMIGYGRGEGQGLNDYIDIKQQVSSTFVCRIISLT